MSAALHIRMTLAEFVAWEERQETRHEFDGEAPVAMTGARAAHAAIQLALLGELRTRLRGGPCRAFGSDLKVAVAGRIRYPDAFVVCTPVTAGTTVVTEPVVVFEIPGVRTMRTDLVEKNAEYRATPSIRRYVVLQQSGPAATVFSHRNGEWSTDLLSGPDAVLEMPEIGLDLPLGALYDDLPPEDPAEA